MKYCYDTSFTVPKKSQRSRFLGLFWKEETLSYNQRNKVILMLEKFLLLQSDLIKVCTVCLALSAAMFRILMIILVWITTGFICL